MNKTKHPMTNKLEKKRGKEIRSAQGRYPVQQTQQYSDELTTKEMLKKFPKRKSEKQEETLKSAQRGISLKKKLQHKIKSKNTTPGLVSSDSAPAHIHPEGKRWMKTLVKQNLSQRAILAHQGIGKKK